MVAKEDVISLVVEGDDSPTFELWFLWEEAGQHAGDGVAKTSREVVENDLWLVCSDFSMALWEGGRET